MCRTIKNGLIKTMDEEGEMFWVCSGLISRENMKSKSGAKKSTDVWWNRRDTKWIAHMYIGIIYLRMRYS